jgi:hypothetical protein
MTRGIAEISGWRSSHNAEVVVVLSKDAEELLGCEGQSHHLPQTVFFRRRWPQRPGELFVQEWDDDHVERRGTQ